MVSTLDIKNLFDKYGEEFDFTGGTSPEQIKLLENELNVSFSTDYKWFLENYGSGGVLGIDILGIAKNDISTIGNTTKRLRNEYGLDSNLYVLEDCDAFFYCGNSQNEKIYYWDRDGGIGPIEANDFLTFLKERISGMAEDFE